MSGKVNLWDVPRERDELTFGSETIDHGRRAGLHERVARRADRHGCGERDTPVSSRRPLTRNLLPLDLFEECLFTLDQEFLDTQVALRVVRRQVSQLLHKALRDLTVRISELLSARISTLLVALTDSIALFSGELAPFSSTMLEIESKLDTRECIENGRLGANELRSPEPLESKYGSGALRPPLCLENCLLAAARKLSYV